ncbi:hypothetical protein DBT82_RS18615 [Vibrio parahaemolyticus]|nr:hypothetical protein [Vibrio parahaemolyticus]EJG0553678.1 hypothetical protein [Vibrio parahaemolyticus]
MRKINKACVAHISGLHEKMGFIENQFNSLLSDFDSQIKKVVDEFNDKHSEQLEELQVLYSEAALELKGVVSEQIDLMKTYIGDRTDAWHDGDSGSKYCYWSELWEEFNEFLERAEYQEFEFEVKLRTFEFEELPPFNPNLNQEN